VQVKDPSGVWRQLWTANGLTSSSWSTQVYDVTAWAAGNPSFQVRFQQGARFGRDAGWNVDALILRDASVPTYGACGGCAGAPAFAGAVAATDVDWCAASGIEVSWAVAPAWGTGNGGTYAVYRDTSPGFAPSPANLVASGVVGTAWTDPSAPTGTSLYYVVRAENDETCDGGPNNGGVEDANLVHVGAVDETSQPDPGTVGETLRVDPVNAAHTRLTWIGSGTAATYHVYSSAIPDGGFVQVATTVAPLYEDAGALGNGVPSYYLVVAADACGIEEIP
jgi:hypothetical protein